MTLADPAPRPGLLATVSHTVGEADTAAALRSGTVPVLATPRVLALAEEATVAALDEALPEGSTTVGVMVQLDHLVANRVGSTVTARAEVVEVSGRRCTFAVTVHDEAGVVARGTVVRAVVDVDAFLARAR